MLFPYFYLYFYKNKISATKKTSPGSTPGTTKLSTRSNNLRPSRLYQFKLRLKEIAYPLTLKDSVISFLLIYGYILSLKNGISFADLAPTLPEEVIVSPRKENNPEEVIVPPRRENNISAIRRDIADIKKDIRNIQKELLETKKMREEISTIGTVCFLSGVFIGALVKWIFSSK